MYKIKKNIQYELFLIPALVAYTVFIVVPLIQSGIYSFTNFDGVQQSYGFVGFQNYWEIFTDDALMGALGFTIMYMVCMVVIITVLAIPLAILLDKKGRGKGIQRAVFFFPAIPSKLLVGYLWCFIFAPTSTGVINVILKNVFHMDAVPWTSDPLLAKISIITVAIWCNLGYHAMLYLAYLQAISNDYYEAAEIDGATWWQKFRYITYPMLAPAMTISLMLLITDSHKIFDLPKAMTDGGPGFSTYTITQVIMLRGVTEQKYGQASAMSMIFCLMVLVIAVIQITLSQRREENVR